jgi:DNA-binding LytR/AlgR family response regulator
MSKVKKCIIVDDEPAAHYVLINYIQKVENLELVQQCYNGMEALNYLNNHEVDLMFLDIDMPEITGLELLKIIKNPPKTILTTAYSEFALESYEYGVIDYLLKPVYFPRFLSATERFLNLTGTMVDEKHEPEVKEIHVKIDSEIVAINLDELLYTQSYGNYVKLILKHRTLLASLTTNALEDMLPSSRFTRIHKSYIVSLAKIENVGNDFVQIGDLKMPVGITYRQKMMSIRKAD